MVLDKRRQFRNDVTNEQILNAVRKNASYDYQRRIPDATKASVENTLKSLDNNLPLWNEFVNVLINRIGMEVYKSKVWNSPLKIFKKGELEYGDTIEEIVTGLLEAKTYDESRDALEQDIWGTETPEVQTAFHKVNRKNYYKLTVNEAQLKQAFTRAGGLSQFVNALMDTPTTSDNWDEFLLTASLLRSYQDNGGFFNVQVPDLAAAESGEAEAKQFLKRTREIGDTLPFLSRHYNAAGMPAFASADELVFIMTPQVKASIDVDALAAAFNMDKATMPGRIVVIPPEYLDMPGTQAIVTTEDFFMLYDSLFRTESIFNPVSIATNYFLHHWEVISYSRFVPAVRLSTDPTTVIEGAQLSPTGVHVPEVVNHGFAKVTDVARGESYGVDSWADFAENVGSIEAGEVLLSVTGGGNRTYITQHGTLYVGADEEATELTVHARDKSGEHTAETTVQVTGDILRLWPNPEVVTPDTDEED